MLRIQSKNLTEKGLKDLETQFDLGKIKSIVIYHLGFRVGELKYYKDMNQCFTITYGVLCVNCLVIHFDELEVNFND